MRDKKTGQFIPGHSGNPGGRPSDKKLRENIYNMFGEGGEDLISLLTCQMLGIPIKIDDFPNAKKFVESRDFRKFLTNKKKSRKPHIDLRLMSDNIKYLIDRGWGKALTNINAEIDNKVTNVKMDLPENLSEEDF